MLVLVIEWSDQGEVMALEPKNDPASSKFCGSCYIRPVCIHGLQG